MAGGVFEPRIPANASVLDDLDLEHRMAALAAAAPDRYRASPGPVTLVDRGDLSTADVDALRQACRTPREAAFLALVSTTGVRSCAVALARVGDVWDAARGEVRARVCLREKNSDTRSFVPCPELREHLRAYVTASTSIDPSRLLFPNRRRPQCPSPGVARAMLRTLSRRAGFAGRPVSPHMFRHYVVNELMKQGNRLECVSTRGRGLPGPVRGPAYPNGWVIGQRR